VKKFVLLIFLATAICYAPALRNGFVWDDTALVLRDPLIRSWQLIPEGFNHYLFVDATASDFYRPMQRIVYTLDYWAVAFKPALYHATNIFWHALAAIALFLFAQELLLAFGIEEKRRGVIAFVASLIWAIHPVHSAAVVYVSGLADPLAAAFGFFGCYCVLRSIRSPKDSALLWLISSGLLFLLSAFSKEIGFNFPIVSIALFSLLKKWRGVWQTGVVVLFVCAIYFSLRASAEHYPPPPPQSAAALSVRPITMARAFAEYTGLILLPVNLHMDRQVDAFLAGSTEHNIDAMAWRELQTLLGIILIGLTIFWAWRARKRNRLVFTLLVLAGITYLPVSGVWLLNATVAEHWIYIPSAFVFLAATVSIVDLAQNKSWPRSAMITLSILATAWCVFLGVRTFIRTFDWKDQRTFLERTIASHGDSARMLINLGGLELSVGRTDLAKKYLLAALRKEPDQPLAILNLAAAALKENDFKTAHELLTRAAQMPLVDARANELLAVLENKEHHRADLLRLRLAARTGMPDWSIERRYIKVLDEVGSTPAALNELRHCLATQWYRAESWQLLGQLLAKTGQNADSTAAFNQARDYDVHLNDHAESGRE
jgi:tetratricopeptide (TPR) repeat protein